MCDKDHLSSMPRVNRREFARMGVAAGAGAVAMGAAGGALAQSVELTEKDVVFDVGEDRFDGFFVAPARGRHPAVILWPDIAGIRDAKRSMGRRLAREGYAVLVANPYFRSVEGEQFEDFDAWREGGGFDRVRPWMAANTPEAIAASITDIVAWLDDQDEVDRNRGVGNQGYCMTGSWTIRAAAALPGRVKAAASFHGGGLVGEGDDAPVNLLDDIAADCKVLIAIARNDDAQAPTDKDALRAAAAASGRDISVEVYNADHGWTVLDSPVYDDDEAERAWEALLALYSSAL